MLSLLLWLIVVSRICYNCYKCEFLLILTVSYTRNGYAETNNDGKKLCLHVSDFQCVREGDANSENENARLIFSTKSLREIYFILRHSGFFFYWTVLSIDRRFKIWRLSLKSLTIMIREESGFRLIIHNNMKY